MDRFYINELHGIYSCLLTDRQNEMLTLHYCDDLSFGEIAEMFSITRSAVLDAVNKARNALVKYENNMHFYETINQINKCVADGMEGICDTQKCLLKIKNILES